MLLLSVKGLIHEVLGRELQALPRVRLCYTHPIDGIMTIGSVLLGVGGSGERRSGGGHAENRGGEVGAEHARRTARSQIPGSRREAIGFRTRVQGR